MVAHPRPSGPPTRGRAVRPPEAGPTPTDAVVAGGTDGNEVVLPRREPQPVLVPARRPLGDDARDDRPPRLRRLAGCRSVSWAWRPRDGRPGLGAGFLGLASGSCELGSARARPAPHTSRGRAGEPRTGRLRARHHLASLAAGRGRPDRTQAVGRRGLDAAGAALALPVERAPMRVRGPGLEIELRVIRWVAEEVVDELQPGAQAGLGRLEHMFETLGGGSDGMGGSLQGKMGRFITPRDRGRGRSITRPRGWIGAC